MYHLLQLWYDEHVYYLISQVENLEAEERYCRTIRQLLDDHQSVVTHLAEGFHECQKNVPVRQNFQKIYFTIIFVLLGISR